MYAVIETGGKQIKAEAGRFIDIEKLSGNKGDKVSFDILMLVSGKDTKIGTPLIPKATVNGHIMENDRKSKVLVYKMRPKKGYKVKQGHRQNYSRVFIESIEIDGKKVATAEKQSSKIIKKGELEN